MAEAYKLADKSIKEINRVTLKRKNQAKSKLLLDFDELNVMRQVDSLYSDADKQIRKQYKKLWKARFLEVIALLIAAGFIKRKPNEDEIEELLEMHMAGLLENPSEVTHYTYAHEVLRKRDKAKEAILSVPTKAQKQIELDKHIRYLLAQSAWYADFTSQDAEISAYEEAKVQRVQRHEQQDERVCAVCKSLDGTIYDVDKIPILEHIGCRRFFSAIS